MLRMMMMQMGQKPSQKKINQMMTMMNKNMDQNMKSSKIIFKWIVVPLRFTILYFCSKTTLVLLKRKIFNNVNNIQ